MNLAMGICLVTIIIFKNYCKNANRIVPQSVRTFRPLQFQKGHFKSQNQTRGNIDGETMQQITVTIITKNMLLRNGLIGEARRFIQTNAQLLWNALC